eukprot:736631_1
MDDASRTGEGTSIGNSFFVSVAGAGLAVRNEDSLLPSEASSSPQGSPSVEYNFDLYIDLFNIDLWIVVEEETENDSTWMKQMSKNGSSIGREIIVLNVYSSFLR